MSEEAIATAEFLVQLVMIDETKNGGMLSRATLVQAQKLEFALKQERRKLEKDGPKKEGEG